MKLTSRQIEAAVFLLGVVVLGLVQGKVREHLGDGWSFVAVIAYLLGLRGLGLLVANLSAEPERGNEP
jgi:hypothetical protein